MKWRTGEEGNGFERNEIIKNLSKYLKIQLINGTKLIWN